MTEKSPKLVFKEELLGFAVFSQFGRYRMYKLGLNGQALDTTPVMAEMFNQNLLETKYKGDFRNWYFKIRSDRMETIASYHAQINDLHRKIMDLKTTWRI